MTSQQRKQIAGPKVSYLEGPLCRQFIWEGGVVTINDLPWGMSRAARVKAVHPDLQQVSRCHNYQIAFKHSYNCTRCNFK